MYDSNYLKSCRTSLRDYLIEFLLGFYKPIRLFVLLYIITINFYFKIVVVEVHETVYTYKKSVSVVDDHGFVHPTIPTSVSSHNPQKTGETCHRRADQYVNLMI